MAATFMGISDMSKIFKELYADYFSPWRYDGKKLTYNEGHLWTSPKVAPPKKDLIVLEYK